VKTVQQTVDRWKTNAGAAQTTFTQGVQNTQVDVMARAIAAAGAAVTNYAQAVSSGRWARAITESGGTANWKAQTEKKAANYGTGIAAGADKFQNAMNKLLPYMAQGLAGLPPRVPGNIGASKARASAWIDYMHAGKGAFKG
jgi:hypothetical protein